MPHQNTAVLIISSAENDENTATNNRFVENLNLRLGNKCEVEWHNYNNIGIEMAYGFIRAFIVSANKDINDYSVVYFKSYFRYHEQATSIVEALREHKTPFIGRELKHYIPAYKLTQLARLARGGVHIPHTIYLPLEHYLGNYESIRMKLGPNFIFKAIDGSTGKDNYLVKSRAQLRKIIDENQGRHFIAQAFINNDSDLRVLIVGDQPRLAIVRKRKDNTTHLNNTSQGADAELLPLTEIDGQLKEIALKSAELMNREVAGVDIMIELGTGIPYVLEVNASPQVASGAFEEEKLDIYADYFSTLVSSARFSDQTLIGRTETIDLPGLELDSVPGRVDTGARTSTIWASNIEEKNGTLKFNLFDERSQFYTGKVIETRKYGRRAVTNSTGNTEERYTIKTPTILKGRKILATFTLADRSSQTYPILIGRNILHGKFLVDVKLESSDIIQAKEKQ